MAKMLLKTTDIYRVDDETEAVEMIQNYKNNQATEGYTLTKSGYVLKNKKAKRIFNQKETVYSVIRSYL